MKFRRATLSIGVVSLALSSASSAWAEVKIGIAGPETGKNQFTGEQQLAGAQKAVDIINAAGGLLGQQITVVSVDDACDPKQAEAAARQLVSEGVIAVIGHVCSGASMNRPASL
jgi:branched-chain amino acid transport system substrate-binding protein